MLMDPERVGEIIGITAMGNEGAQWIGMAPFVDADHLIQNLGDGTYFHSGQLSVQRRDRRPASTSRSRSSTTAPSP